MIGGVFIGFLNVYQTHVLALYIYKYKYKFDKVDLGGCGFCVQVIHCFHTVHCFLYNFSD